MQKYSQLSLESRYQIKALLDAGHNQSEVAQTIGVHRSTISRELKRNVANGSPAGKPYCPDTAQWLTEEKLSPELISGRWEVIGIDGVSHETLYQWIWAAKHTDDPTDKDLYKHLKHGRHKRKRGNRRQPRNH